MSEQHATYLSRSVAAWTPLVTDDDPMMRRLGVYALGEIGPEAQSAVPLLEAAAKDSVPLVRVWAAAALARVNPDNKAGLDGLLAALGDEQYFIRSLGAWHLGRLGPDYPGIDTAVSALKGELRDADRSVICEAGIALRKLTGRGRPPEELQTVGETA